MAPTSLDRAKKLLFIGDSITDAGRLADPDRLGNGYVRLIRDYLVARHPAAAPEVVNRGTGGNKITDLDNRWDTDVIAECPDLLTVYVGINDIWHDFYPTPGNGVSLDRYRERYASLLARTRAALPGCGIVLCEPSVLWPPVPPEAAVRLPGYVQAVHDLARQFTTSVAPLNAAFESTRKSRPDVPLTTDGVHPTSTGHMVIAHTWLQTVGALA